MENKKLKQTIFDERTGIEYNLVNDYYIPNIVLPRTRRTGNVGKKQLEWVSQMNCRFAL